MTRRVGRGYSWPAFTRGNEVALRHGAWSPRKIDPLASELVESVSRQVEWWRPADMPSVWAWARTEARVQLLTEWLAERGDLDDDGNVRAAADLLTRLEARAQSLRSALGLDPTSRARLGRDVAAAEVDLAGLRVEGRRIIEARGFGSAHHTTDDDSEAPADVQGPMEANQ